MHTDSVAAANTAAGYGRYYDNQGPGICWGAVLAGGAGASAISIILAFLGFGLGMTAISPWAGSGASASTLGVGGIVWLALMQLIAAGLGGYLAGRLRHRWNEVQADEVHFRDTAHGFLAWAVGTLAVSALFAGATAGLLRTGAEAVAGVGSTATIAAAASARPDRAGMQNDNGIDYAVDLLLRAPAGPAANASTAAPAATDTDAPATTDATPATGTPRGGDWRGDANRGVAVRIFTHSIASGQLAPADASYLAQIVAQRTGMSAADADAQVHRAYDQLQQGVTAAKEAADKARHAAAWSALWMFVALLIGAFFASFMALVGGRQRDL